MKRVVMLCLTVLILLVPALIGCKTGEGKVESKEAPPEQKKLGADLMKQLPANKGQ